MKLIFCISLFLLLTSCWPSSVSFKDAGSMPIEWKSFHVKTLEVNAPNCPLFYGAQLTEKIKDGVQNNTRLSLATKLTDAEVQIEGEILNYQVSPIAIQNGDNASKNRLSLTVQFTINSTKPTEEKLTLTSSRFEDFEATTNLSSIENQLLENITEQIIQDLINKLMSNW